jgi:hypothetical protein
LCGNHDCSFRAFAERLHGRLDQLVGDNWAITEAGIEHRATNRIAVAESAFPQRLSRLGPQQQGRHEAASWNLVPPPGATDAE